MADKLRADEADMPLEETIDDDSDEDEEYSISDDTESKNSLTTEDKAIERYLESPEKQKPLLIRAAKAYVHESLNIANGEYNPNIQDKPNAKKIKTFILHNAIIRPDFMEQHGFPQILRDRIVEMLQHNKNNLSPSSDEVKTKIIGEILNQKTTTSLEQIKSLKEKIRSEINSINKTPKDYPLDESDVSIFVNTLLIEALELLGDNVENYYIKVEVKKDEQ